MSLQILLGGSTVSVALPPTISEEAAAASPGTANATLTFNSDGSYVSGDGTPAGNWRIPTGTGVGSGYEIRWVTGTGTLSTGTADTWEPLSSAVTYGRNRTSVGINTATGTIQIRIASGATLTSSAATLEAEVTL